MVLEWKMLTDMPQISEIKQQTGYSLIFKHSTRCSVSLMAKKRLEMDWEIIPAETSLYFLDLIKHRDLSAKIAETFHVHHESPQILLIKDGDCILDASHGEISANEIAGMVSCKTY